MMRTSLILVLGTLGLGAAGCTRYGHEAVGIARMEPPADATVQCAEPVTGTGREAAVLSLHRREWLPEACRYGLTLTNHLPFEITDLGLRFTALGSDGTVFQGVTRVFYGVLPTQSQYREITFQISCGRIDYVEVTDTGRCIMGDLTRRSAQHGDCIRHVDIPASPFVRIVKGEPR